jgi:hypothetical protein
MPIGNSMTLAGSSSMAIYILADRREMDYYYD